MDERLAEKPAIGIDKVKLRDDVSSYLDRVLTANSPDGAFLKGRLSTLLHDIDQGHLQVGDIKAELKSVLEAADTAMKRAEPASPIYEVASEIKIELGKL